MDTQQQMESIGALIRRARERKNMSLGEVAQATKIRAVSLSAIEADAFHELPAGIFRRGLLRAYASHVGLDPREIIHRYTLEFEPVADIADASAASVKGEAAGDPIPRIRITFDLDRLRRYRVSIGIALLVAVGVAYYLTFVRGRAASRSSAPAVAAAPDRIAAVLPASDATATTAKAAAALRVEITARDRCWVDATADGVRVVYRVMEAGETQQLEAKDSVILRIGRPTAVTYTINGQPGRLRGPPGEPATVRLTSQNYQQFVGQ